MEELKIRKLLKKDQEVIAAMFKRLIDEVDDKSIQHIISSASGDVADGGKEITDAERTTQVIRVFSELFTKVIGSFHDDVITWFADLAGITVELYREQEIDIDVKILNQIMEASEVANFFTGASHLYNTTAWLKSMLKGLKEKFGFISDAVDAISKS